MDDEPGGEQVTVLRGHSARDSAGNSYGIIDIHPDPADLAVLLGVRAGHSGERAQLVLREHDTVDRLGLRVQALDITVDAPARVILLVERLGRS